MSGASIAGTRIGARFVIEGLAGSGGLGVVYRARDELTGRMVAVKMIREYRGGHEVERFAREARLLAELRHPGIVGHLAHGETDAGEPYLVMEWLEGEDLARRLERGALSLEHAVALVRHVAEALAVAHERGVVHRDLKPANLFLRGGRVDDVAILDFGIARRVALSELVTRTGAMVGTPVYMAPEQARGQRDITPAVDVFALGCVLFECLTGGPPFAAEQPLAVLAKILLTDPPPLRQLRPDAPEALEALIKRALSKDPADRPAGAAVFGHEIAALGALPASEPHAISTQAEHEVVSVVMAFHPRAAESPASDGATVEIGNDELHQLLARRGARVESITEAALVATISRIHAAATDLATQAARCALIIRQHWPRAVIAVCTGRALRGESATTGEVFDRVAGLARRGAAAGYSDEILLDEATRGLLEVRFRVRRMSTGEHALGGDELELDASRPLLGKPTPCVGRDTELAMLDHSLTACVEEERPQVVIVTAPAGAGKSRLRHEFLRRAHARNPGLLVLAARGEPLSAGSSYGFLAQALRRSCGIHDGDSLDDRRAKLSARVNERLDGAARAHTTAFLGELCVTPFPDGTDPRLRAARQDPLVMSENITRALTAFLRAECAAQPVLIVLEDLHWGDALTVKLCESALQFLDSSPLMVLALARPEVDAHFPRLWSDRAQVLPLRPLGARAAERLVRHVMGPDVGAETVARIVVQAAGNALFLEELIRCSAEGRVGDAPQTVLASLQLRIGRLESGARRTLRAASVFGETFWSGGLAAALGDSASAGEIESALMTLVREEIVEVRDESRFPGERELRFRHALMRDAAYDLLTEGDRATYHRLTAGFLEAHDDPDAFAIAEHYRQGGTRDRALPHYVRAAEQALDAFTLDLAEACAQQGLACGATGEVRGALLGVSVAVGHWRDAWETILASGLEALELLEPGTARWSRVIRSLFPAATLLQRFDLLPMVTKRFLGTEPDLAGRGAYVRAAVWPTSAFAITGQRPFCEMFLGRMRQVAALVPDDWMTQGHAISAEVQYHLLVACDPYRSAQRSAEGARMLFECGDRVFHTIVLRLHGEALTALGDTAAAEAALREDLRLAEQLDEPFILDFVRIYLARLLATHGPDAQLDEPEALARAALRAQQPLAVGMALGVLAQVALRRGDFTAAEAHARQADAMLRPFAGVRWDIAGHLVTALRNGGKLAEARELGSSVWTEYERGGCENYGDAVLALAVAEAHLAAGDTEASRALARVAAGRIERRLDAIPEAPARAWHVAIPAHARLFALTQ